MENATEALKMAGAMLLFVFALSVTIMVFSSAREASTSVMEYPERRRTFYDIDEANLLSEREVQVDTVIAKLYGAYSSQETIAFYKGTRNGNTINSIQEVTLYYTEAKEKETQNGSSNVLKDSTLVVDSSNRAIYGIDLADELLRDEPWQSNEKNKKNFIDALVNRKNSPVYSRSLADTSVINPSNTFSRDPRGIIMGFTYNFDGYKTPLINLTRKVCGKNWTIQFRRYRNTKYYTVIAWIYTSRLRRI